MIQIFLSNIPIKYSYQIFLSNIPIKYSYQIFLSNIPISVDDDKYYGCSTRYLYLSSSTLIGIFVTIESVSLIIKNSTIIEKTRKENEIRQIALYFLTITDKNYTISRQEEII